MTRTIAAPQLGGAGSVLVIWSLVVVVVGASLFTYSVVVTMRGRRRRRRRTAPSMHRPMPPPPASRPLALPAGSGQAYRQPGLNTPRSGQPGFTPSWPGGQLPTGPTAGGIPLGRAGRALPPGLRPLALPAGSSAPDEPHESPVLPAVPIAGSGYGAMPPTTYGNPTVYGGSEPPAVTALPAAAVYGSATTVDAPHEPPGKPRRSGKHDECATLRAECEQLRAIAATAASAAAQAATDAEDAHGDYVAAQRAADEARRAVQQLAHESADVAAQLANLEKTALTPEQQKVQSQVRDAAFAAYRRGDISSDQMREVFKRAEGWTPEHDRLSRRTTELRAEEVELTRVRDNAVLAEETAAERARTAANTARTLDEQSRTAALDARGRCAAADACERRNRRR